MVYIQHGKFYWSYLFLYFKNIFLKINFFIFFCFKLIYFLVFLDIKSNFKKLK